jgi:phospholipid N-methyltransferase
MQCLDFMWAFLKNWREVGWPWQTSRSGARKICKAIDFQNAHRIIEIGPGTGVVTREILKSLRRDAELIVFEINRDLCRHLRAIPDHRLVVYNLSGFELPDRLREKADYIISEIPVATLSGDSFDRFYSGIRTLLREQGVCIQLQLSLASFQKLRRAFRSVQVAFTLLNPPPLFIYLCRGPSDAAAVGERDPAAEGIRPRASLSNNSVV